MDCIVHGVAKSQTGLSDFHFHFSWLKVLRSIGLRINIPSLERVEKCVHFLLFVFYLLVFILLIFPLFYIRKCSPSSFLICFFLSTRFLYVSFLNLGSFT